MDILNFISWLKGKRVVSSVDATQTLIPVGLKDPKRDDGYLAGAISVADFSNALVPSFTNRNVKLGDNTLVNNISGQSNVAIGTDALRYNQSSYNTAIGDSALATLSPNPAYCVAIGKDSMRVAGNLFDTVAIGVYSAEGSSSSQSIMIGTGAGTNSSGGDKVCIGYYAGFSNYSTEAVAIGTRALQYGGGSNNVAIGLFALQQFGAKIRNTAIGSYAMYSTTNGGENSSLGYNTLYDLTTGTRNVAVGTNSLSTLTIGSFNTALGYATSTSSSSINGCIILGMGAQATANNQLVIGSTAIPVGSVTTESLTSTQTLTVILNGVSRKILLA